MSILQIFLIFDSALLFLAGGSFIIIPVRVAALFHLNALTPEIRLMLGICGCVYASLGVGYFLAAHDPYRNISWIQVGIVRGGLECIAGIFYMVMGTATFQQAGFGTIIGAVVALAYLILYPRPAKGAA